MRQLYAAIIKEHPEIEGADVERSVHQTPDDGSASQPKKTKRRRRRTSTNDESLPYTNPEDHHHIAQSQRDVVELDTWLDVHGGTDPALKVCPSSTYINFVSLSLYFPLQFL